MIPPHVQEFCDTNGYTEPQRVNGRWWAFPPNGRMPVPIRPVQDILTPLEVIENFRRACQQPSEIRMEAVTITLPDGSVHSLANLVKRLQNSALTAFQVPVRILQEREQIRTVDRPVDPTEAVLWHLRCHDDMESSISRVRLREFCAIERLTPESVFQYLRSGKVIVRHGVLCRGKGFPGSGYAPAIAAKNGRGGNQ